MRTGTSLLAKAKQSWESADMYGYIWFYEGKRGEVYAETLYKAKLAALKALGIHPMATRKASRVSVVLAETPDGPVIHKPQDITP
jgi:hypothetical protein